ncbi:hypothetical protein SDC9_160333 [bioreactor metagenome]|uniref:Uncharacterized protein n=1 Tax=bioreactor metagenome TaxID=1076179 RepID=A0A645FLD4_9ZZZZ
MSYHYCIYSFFYSIFEWKKLSGFQKAAININYREFAVRVNLGIAMARKMLCYRNYFF